MGQQISHRNRRRVWMKRATSCLVIMGYFDFLFIHSFIHSCSHFLLVKLHFTINMYISFPTHVLHVSEYRNKFTRITNASKRMNGIKKMHQIDLPLFSSVSSNLVTTGGISAAGSKIVLCTKSSMECGTALSSGFFTTRDVSLCWFLADIFTKSLRFHFVYRVFVCIFPWFYIFCRSRLALVMVEYIVHPLTNQEYKLKWMKWMKLSRSVCSSWCTLLNWFDGLDNSQIVFVRVTEM